MMLKPLSFKVTASEIVGDGRSRNKEGFLLKLDFKKAYDKADWDYLDRIMEFKRFEPKWRRWMRGCLTTANFSTLINGKPRGKILAKRGVVQGDPLSPFLFHSFLRFP